MRIFGLEIRKAGSLVPVSNDRGLWRSIIREPFTGAWQRNQEWTTDTVLAHQAVYACITRIAQDIGKLRPKLVEQDANGLWREITNTAHSPVLSQPNRFQNYIQFGEWWTTSKLTHGNAYALKRFDNRGVVDALYLLDPTRVTPMIAPDGEVFYQLKIDPLSELRQDEVAVPARMIVHDRMNCLFHPLVGTSPIFACGAAANLGLNIQRDSSSFFGRGANPSGILSSPATITSTKSKELSELWNSMFSGDNSGNVAVLGDGMKFEAMRMTAVDAQLIEQLRWTAEVVCSVFHVPAWKVGIGSMPAYTKPEIANQSYYSDCLQSPIEQYELCLDEALGLRKPIEGRGRLGVELDLEGLLRMDQASLVETLTKASGGPVMTPDEARARFDLPPLPGGNTIYKQHQDYPMEMVYNRTDLDKPEPAPPALPPGEPVEDEEDEPPPPDDDARMLEIAQRIRLRSLTMRVAA